MTIDRRTFIATLACLPAASPVQAKEAIVLANLVNFTSILSGVVLTEIYRRVDLDLTVLAMPPARASIEASTGRVDGEVNRVASYGAAHPTLIRIDPPLCIWTVSAFHKKTDKFTIQSAIDLAPRSVGKVRGIVGATLLTSGLPNVQDANSSKSLMQMLDLDRFEVAVDGTFESEFHLQQLQLKNINVVELTRYALHHYLHEKHRDLVPVIGNMIEKLS
ncbi:MAG: hypothetical protein V4447_14150, partial [Pseudomonadota bacterium]